MTTDTAHKSWWQIFEVIAGLPFLVAIGLQFAVPLSFPPGFLTQASVPAGILLIAIGVTLIILARRELARYRQPTDPGRPTSQVVTTGVFSISRNPFTWAAYVFSWGSRLSHILPGFSYYSFRPLSPATTF